MISEAQCKVWRPACMSTKKSLEACMHVIKEIFGAFWRPWRGSKLDSHTSLSPSPLQSSFPLFSPPEPMIDIKNTSFPKSHLMAFAHFSLLCSNSAQCSVCGHYQPSVGGKLHMHERISSSVRHPSSHRVTICPTA